MRSSSDPKSWAPSICGGLFVRLAGRWQKTCPASSNDCRAIEPEGFAAYLASAPLSSYAIARLRVQSNPTGFSRPRPRRFEVPLAIAFRSGDRSMRRRDCLDHRLRCLRIPLRINGRANRSARQQTRGSLRDRFTRTDFGPAFISSGILPSETAVCRARCAGKVMPRCLRKPGFHQVYWHHFTGTPGARFVN